MNAVTSPRDLAEADAFERRRMVSALVTGRGDPAVGEPRPARCVMGGLMLAAALVAAPTVSHAMTGHPVLRWDHGHVRISR